MESRSLLCTRQQPTHKLLRKSPQPGRRRADPVVAAIAEHGHVIEGFAPEMAVVSMMDLEGIWGVTELAEGPARQGVRPKA